MRLSVSPSLTNQGELNWDPLPCPSPLHSGQEHTEPSVRWEVGSNLPQSHLLARRAL